MKGQRVHEYVVPFPAADVWEIVGSLELPQLVRNMPGVLEDLTVIGDGSVGTIFILTVPDGWPFKVYRERIATVDHGKMLKNVDVIEGAVLDFGFTSCTTRFEVFNLGSSVSMFRGTILFEIDDAKATQAVVDMVDLMQMDGVANAIAHNIVDKKSYARKLAGDQSFERAVSHPAADVWDVYSTLKLPELLKQVFPDVQWQGDGSVGTIYTLTLNPGPLPSYKEKVVTLNHEKRIKELDVIEGGYLEKDFTFYRTRFEIIETSPTSCIIRSIIIVELNQNATTAAENMKLANVMVLKAAGDVTADYLANKSQAA